MCVCIVHFTLVYANSVSRDQSESWCRHVYAIYIRRRAHATRSCSRTQTFQLIASRVEPIAELQQLCQKEDPAMKVFLGMRALLAKHLDTIVIFSLLTILSAFLYLMITLKPSISAFRIVIITLGSTLICSVLICLMSGYIRSYSKRKLTFPVHNNPKNSDTCLKTLPPDSLTNANLLDVVSSTE